MNKDPYNKTLSGFSEKAFIFNEEGKFLTIRRTETAPSNPLKWDIPGGDVEFGEDAYDAVLREIKDESGLEVKNLSPFDIYAYVTSSGDYWMTVAYKASVAGGEFKVSSEHDLHNWVTIDEFLKLDISDKLRRFGERFKEVV